MLFLSRFTVDLNTIRALKSLNDLQEQHRDISNILCCDRTISNYLYRVENHGTEASYEIVSKIRPNIAQAEKIGWKQEFCIDLSEYFKKIKKGNTLNFKLKAFPSRSVHSHVYPYKEGEYAKWLIDRSKTNGFEIKKLNCIKMPAEYGRRPDGNTIIVNPVFYIGTLKVTDIEQFINAMSNGIGRKKGYGEGLLSIPSITENVS